MLDSPTSSRSTANRTGADGSTGWNVAAGAVWPLSLPIGAAVVTGDEVGGPEAPGAADPRGPPIAVTRVDAQEIVPRERHRGGVLGRGDQLVR